MKKLHVIFLILAVLILMAPAVAMPFFQDAVNTEKRELSQLPAIIQEDGSFNQRFAVEMNTWIQEHIGFRGPMIAVNNRLRTGLFGQGATDDIVVGKDDWLFYYESVDDYLHVPTITPRNAANAARTAALFEAYAREQGSGFLLAFLPNKNSVYGEKMPYYFRPRQGEEGSRELFLKALQAEGVSFVDALPALQTAAGKGQIYQKQDSHWTYEGALIGYRAIMEAGGHPYEPFEGLTFKYERNWPADLAAYLYGEGARPDVQAYPDYTFTYEYKSRTTAVDSLSLETRQPAGQGSLVIYRDSFVNTMQAYLAQSFEKAYFSRAIPYQASLIGRQKADLTVLQLTERSLGSYVFRAPQMPAPSVDLEGEGKLLKGDYASLRQEKAGEEIHLFGTVDPGLLGETYRVYVLMGEAGQARAFEAFPIYEKEWLGEAPVEDNGWSLYLPAEQLEGNPALQLVVESEGKRYVIPLQP